MEPDGGIAAGMGGPCVRADGSAERLWDRMLQLIGRAGIEAP